jgi:hypothetical protein
MIPKIKNKPAGNRLIKKMRLETKSLLLATFSVFLISLGLYVFGNAITVKQEGAEIFRWALLGTYSLVLINLGFFCIAQAIRFRILIDINKRTKKSEKNVYVKLKRKSIRNKNFDE